MTLTYLLKTFDLIGVTPRVSSQALFWLDRIEIETGIRLPGAVRELMSVVHIQTFFDGHIDSRVSFIGLDIQNLLSYPERVLYQFDDNHFLHVCHDEIGYWENTGIVASYLITLNSETDPLVYFGGRYGKLAG